MCFIDLVICLCQAHEVCDAHVHLYAVSVLCAHQRNEFRDFLECYDISFNNNGLQNHRGLEREPPRTTEDLVRERQECSNNYLLSHLE